MVSILKMPIRIKHESCDMIESPWNELEMNLQTKKSDVWHLISLCVPQSPLGCHQLSYCPWTWNVDFRTRYFHRNFVTSEQHGFTVATYSFRKFWVYKNFLNVLESTSFCVYKRRNGVKRPLKIEELNLMVQWHKFQVQDDQPWKKLTARLKPILKCTKKNDRNCNICDFVPA